MYLYIHGSQPPADNIMQTQPNPTVICGHANMPLKTKYIYTLLTYIYVIYQ